MYIYGSHDAFNGEDFCVNDYVCYSAPVDNLKDWKYEGVIYKASQDPRGEGNHMCAPDVAQGPDGRYYLYYQLHRLTCTCVAVADKPQGPFEYYGAVQHPDGTPWGEKKGDAFAFDPGVFVDDDGKRYLYVGFSPVGLFKFVFKMRGTKVDGSVCLELDEDMKTVIGGEMPMVPGQKMAKKTEFAEHPFFEASSMRKCNGKYYYVYSSLLSHELCYAVSDYPNKDFKFGGTIISIGDVGLDGRTPENAVNSLGNTHGGMELINGQWYIFYHRQTNRQKCARQGCAEPITIAADGSIPQVEITSCGLNGGSLEGKGTYGAYIASHLTAKEGVLTCKDTHEKDEENVYPFFTQTGEDRLENPDQYVANIKSGATVGFKYFDLTGDTKVSVKVKKGEFANGDAKGKMLVKLSADGDAVATIDIDAGETYADFTATEAITATGKQALYFTYEGTGALDFESFTL